MALKPLNSVGGFSVGLTPINIISSNGEITTGVANITGNVVTGNLFVGPLSTTGNISGGNLSIGGIGSFTGNVSVGNLSTAGQLSATGNVSGNYILGNGAFLTGIDTSLISNGNSSVQVYGNANIAFTVAGNSNVVVVSNTGNVISATGNITAPWFLGNVEGTTLSASGTATVGNLSTEGAISATGTATVGNVSTGGTISATGTANVGNLVVPGTSNVTGAAIFGNTISATGNVTAPYFIGNLVGNITGNIDAGGPNTSIQFNDSDILNGSSGFTFDKTSNAMFLAGTANVGNLVSPGTVSATGNVTAPWFIGNVDATSLTASGNANVANLNASAGVFASTLSTTGTATVGNVSTSGTVSAGGTVTGGNLATTGTLSAGGNANVGNLGTTGVFATTLSATGTATVSGNLTAGNISTAGTANVGTLAVVNDATVGGNVTIGTGSGGNLTGANVVSANTFSGNLLATTANVTGTANIGNLIVPGTSNVTGAAVFGNTISATGNVTAPYFIGNLVGNVSGNISAAGTNTQVQFNDGGVIGATSGFTFDKSTNALFTGGTFSATGTATVGNVSTTGFANVGELNASGNAVIGGNLTVNGTLTYVNVDTLAVEDPIIEQGRGPNGAPLTSNDGKDRGQQMWYYTGPANTGPERSSFSGYDNSEGKMFIAVDVTNSAEVITVNNWGNIRLGNIEGQGTISAVGTLTAGNLSTGGTLNVTGNANVGNLGTAGVFATTLSATGNINGANVVASAGLFGATLNTTGTANVGNLETAGTVSATGNVTGGNLVTAGSVFAPVVTNASGNVAISANGGPNVMVVSTGNVGITGNLSVSGNISGNFSGNVTAAGSNTQILFNDDGLIGANADFTFNKDTDTLQIANSRISVNTVTGGTGVITLASYPVSGFNGVEFIVKGNAASGKTMATVQAVTDGELVDYAVFGALTLSTSPLQGEGLSVSMSGSNIVLQANASVAATWVTQFRLV